MKEKKDVILEKREMTLKITIGYINKLLIVTTPSGRWKNEVEQKLPFYFVTLALRFCNFNKRYF